MDTALHKKHSLQTFTGITKNRIPFPACRGKWYPVFAAARIKTTSELVVFSDPRGVIAC